MKTTNIISTLICICILFIHNTLSTSTGPHRLPSHKRFVKTSHKGSSRLGKVPQDVKAFKRYVIHPHSGSAARLNASPGDFRRKRNTGQGTTFSHSDHQVKLKRTADSSLNVLNKRDTHPLIHWTQHYNQALGRGARTVVNNNRQKRNVVAKEHLRESEERLAKRWQTVPGAENMGKLKLRKRKNILSGLIRDSNMFGGPVHHINHQQINHGNKAANTDSDGLVGLNQAADSGFTQKELDIALASTLTQPNGPLGADSIGLVIEANDVGYYAPVLFGTPPTAYNLLIDSGSADTWVPSVICNDDKTCGGHKPLGSKTSSSFVVSNPVRSFQVTYGTGEVEGAVASDVVAISSNGLTIKNLTFGVTTAESTEFADPDVPFDGLLGLAKSSLSNQKTPTIIERLMADGIVNAAQVGYRLSSALDDTNDSEITFGGVDTAQFNGTMTEVDNVSSSGFWQASLGGVQVDGKDLGATSKVAILDTGTTLIVAPTKDADRLHAAIPGAQPDGQGGYIVPCTTTATVSFTFGGSTFTMKPADLTFVPVDINDLQGDCQSSISSGQIDNEGSWLIGDTFLKNVYFATDATHNKIGLAQIS